MSSVSPKYEVGAAVLGYVGLVASWRRPSAMARICGSLSQPMLTIQSCADTDDGVHTPAASVTISTREGLLALQSAIAEALQQEAA